MWTAYFGAPPVLIHRSIHVGVILFLTFLLYPPIRKGVRSRVPFYDIILALAALSTAVYVITNYDGIVRRFGDPSTADLVFATILVVLVIEAARRLTGWAMPLLAIAFVIYALYGRLFPGIFRHRGYYPSCI